MRRPKQPRSVWINTRFEDFEERLFFNADPLADFHIDEQVLRSPNDQARDLTPTLADVHQMSGVDYVHNTFGFDGSGQTVVVIDSGVAYDHYALGGGLGAGYRVVGGKDFTEENDNDPYDDGPGGFHGTHVAGIIGSSDNTHTGVAPGVDLVALRVFNDQGEGYFSWVENALDWVHDNRDAFANPITAVNLSIGTTWNSDSIPAWGMLEDEFSILHADGIFVSVAAGNDFQDYGEAGLSYPAVSPHVVPVSSVTNSGAFSSFSQRHDRVIAAPGQSITSTVPDYLFDFNGVSDDFGTASGTSMAAPYVAGASVLVRQAMDFAGITNVTQDTIYDHLRDTANLFYDSATNANYHRLDLQSALDTLMPNDDYGSSVSTAFSLGSLTGTSAFNGTIGQINDVDYFTFTANQTGTVSLSAAATHQLDVTWQLAGGSASVNGSAMTFDAVAGQSYTFSLASSEGVGHYDVDVAFDAASTPVNLVDLALQTDEQLGLHFSGSYSENWGGMNEKWLRSAGGDWYFITPEGSLYEWTGQSDLSQSSLYATFDSSYHQDPTRLHDAYTPESDFSTLAYQLDQDLDLDFTGNYFQNWGGWGEKWLLANGNQWHFITPDGEFYRWEGGTDLSQSTLVSTLDSSFYSDPSSLYDAYSLDLSDLAAQLDESLNLSFTGNYYENWGGWGEKWLLSNDSQWYFITPDGAFYRWEGGSDLNQSVLQATLDNAYFDDPSMLFDASTSSVAVQNHSSFLGDILKDAAVADGLGMQIEDREIYETLRIANRMSQVRTVAEIEVDRIDTVMSASFAKGHWFEEESVATWTEVKVEDCPTVSDEAENEFTQITEDWLASTTLERHLNS